MSIVEKLRFLKPRNPNQIQSRNSLDGAYRILEDTPNKQTTEFIGKIRGYAAMDFNELEVRVKSAGLETISPNARTFIKSALENRHLSKEFWESQSRSGKPKHNNVDFSQTRTQIEEDFDRSFGVYLSEEELSTAKSIAASIAFTLTDNPHLVNNILNLNNDLAEKIRQLDTIISESPLFESKLQQN